MPTLALVRGGELITSYHLDKPVVVVGRGDACDITLGGPLVSSKHCQFVAEGSAYTVQDLGSANGTYVNDTRVEKQVLREGDRVAIVPHILVYQALDKEARAVTASSDGDALMGIMDTTQIDTAEVNRHLTRLLADTKAYGFSVSHEAVGGDVDLIKVSGPLDAHTADGFEGAINMLLVDERCKIIIDMSKVSYLASAGVGVLLSAVKEAELGNGKLVLLNPASQAHEVLDLGFTEMFTIARDRQEALSVF